MMMVGDLMESSCQHDGTEKAFTECVCPHALGKLPLT